MIIRRTVPVYASSLIEVVRCHLVGAAGGTAPAVPSPLRQALEERLADPRKPRGIRHSLGSLVPVLVAGVACGYSSPLAIAGAAAGWDQEVLAGHGCRQNPVTGLHEPPSASTLGRLPALLDADQLEAGLSAQAAPAALDPQLAERIAARAAAGTKAGGKKKKVHLLAAVTHVTGLVIGQDKVAKAGKANEITHFRPLLEPLPLDGVVITADAMQTQREHARWLSEDKDAFYLLPVLGNQPGTYAALDALDWEDTPVAAATSEISRGRVETRTIRVLPAPEDLGFPYASQAVLLERYVTIKKNSRWIMRNCEAVLHVTSLDAAQASPADLLAYARGHWTVEHLHWLRDVVWREDKSTLRTGNAPQVMSALTNLVITLFRLQGVTKITAETRRNAQNPRRPLQLFALRPG